MHNGISDTQDKVMTIPEMIEHLGLKKDDAGALLIDPKKVLPFDLNPHEGELRDIPEPADSMMECGEQLTPGAVKLIVDNPNYQAILVDGARRHAAVSSLNAKDPRWLFRAYPTTKVQTVHQHLRASFAANFCRDGHNCIEIAHSIERLLDGGDTKQAIARMAGSRSLTWVEQHLSLLKLAPPLQKMIVETEQEGNKRQKGRLTFSLALNLVNFPHAQQIREANLITSSQMSMVKARRHIRQLGRQTGGREVLPRPGLQFSSLMRLTESFPDQLGIFTDMSDTELRSMFESASPVARQLAVKRLIGIVKNVTNFTEKVLKISKS